MRNFGALEFGITFSTCVLLGSTLVDNFGSLRRHSFFGCDIYGGNNKIVELGDRNPLSFEKV